ncbi:pirin family protein [Nocardioides sp.]|uniref:pirin family protein n=1 Tax=Nocardioides sp. TaxID=35761 RepID=UPI002D8010CE|nr:pirin family protein [Nocardioides sp.]HET8962220.1 pirin family protein [Nocardioides sp.]
MSVEVRRGSVRFATRGEGRITRHSFSFGDHYDPDNVGFGPMVCHDDHLLRGGAGYPDHPHRDLEIVTWVLSGALVHTASVGPPTTVGTGRVQVLSAGTGVSHSEIAETGSGPTRFVQTWVRPDESGVAPSYNTATIGDALASGELVPVVSGRHRSAAARIGTASATLYAALLGAGDTVVLPEDPLQHVFVATGSLARSSLAEPLSAGDAFRITDRPGLTLTAASPTELLVWSFG